MEDSQIIELYWQKNTDAISETAKKYGAYCFAIAENILHNPEDSEECINDTWLHAWNVIPPQKPLILRMFLAKITRNLSLDRLDARNAKKRGSGEIALILDELEECLGSRTDTESAYEAKEYGAAVEFFEDNGLSMEGLSRAEVKAIYRDITTQKFIYGKTAEIIKQTVPGLEITQREPTPEELARLWTQNLWRNQPGAGISYCYDYQYKFDVLDKSILKCYRDGTLLWASDFPGYFIKDSTYTTAGTVVWGRNDTYSSEQRAYSFLARLDENGNILWQHKLNHNFQHEYIAAVLDNGDGTLAVISRGDLKYLCLSQYNVDGSELSFHKTEVGNLGIQNAARLGDGYLVQLWNSTQGETARLVKLDQEGNILDGFIYEGEDCYYTITDMVEFGGWIYLSAYAVPEQNDKSGRYEISNILDYVFDKEDWEISSEELTPIVRDNYTAVLLLCNPNGGAPETFYSVKGSLGGKLNINDMGELVWNVESITNTFFSPATSSFTIGGTCQVFRYTFDDAGILLTQEDSGESIPYSR